MMKRFWRNNSLSLVMLGMFFVAFMFGQTYSGWLEENEDRESKPVDAAHSATGA